MTLLLPWVVGQWVRGGRFYGRAALLAELEAATSGTCWLAGCRRVGKTSVLRELERRALAAPDGPVPLVLDLQGVGSAAELDLAVADAVLDLEPEAVARLGGPWDLAGLEAGAVAELVAAQAVRRGLALLVLVDEAETLATVATLDPGAVAALGEVLAAGPRVRTVVASSVRLEVMARRVSGVAWLQEALTSPRWLGPLAAADAVEVVRQSRLADELRPVLPEGAVERVLALAGGHPFLLQLLAKRVAEAGDPAAAERAVESEPALRSLVDVDLRLLPELDRATVSAVVLGESVSAAGDRVEMLVALGLLRRDGHDRLVPGNAAVARWG